MLLPGYGQPYGQPPPPGELRYQPTGLLYDVRYCDSRILVPGYGHPYGQPPPPGELRAIVLHFPYALSGTDIAYGPTRLLSRVPGGIPALSAYAFLRDVRLPLQVTSAISLRTRWYSRASYVQYDAYAMSGTDLAYAATRLRAAVRPAPPSRLRPAPPSRQVLSAYARAMPCPIAPYAPMQCPECPPGYGQPPPPGDLRYQPTRMLRAVRYWHRTYSKTGTDIGHDPTNTGYGQPPPPGYGQPPPPGEIRYQPTRMLRDVRY
eukprot:3940903-Rhodomonas_salina.1